MRLDINPTAEINGKRAAKYAARLLNRTIRRNGEARLLVSTGASQFAMFDALIKEDVDWTKVEMFHLDEYVGLPYEHPASFRKYLNERFISHVSLKAAYLVNDNIPFLTEKIREKQIDVGLIGIGENGHIAFNDPPADFDTDEAYIIVDLDDKCKMQQVGEGWFENLAAVPKQAISMTVKQIMSCRHIVSVVPNAVKAEAIFNTLNKPVSNMVPATILKTHPDWSLFIDYNSAKLIYNAGDECDCR